MIPAAGGLPEAPFSAAPLRILTFNLHGGLGTDGAFDYDRLAGVIRSAAPDLVALQEVDVRTGRAGGADQATILGKLTGMHSVFGKAMDYDGGAYGQAILSRASFDAVRCVALAAPPGREPRALLEAMVTPPGWTRPLCFRNTHLEHEDAATRLGQAQVVAAVTREGDDPSILCGDFNATPGSEPLAALAPDWTDATAAPGLLSFPADAPSVKIDYILYRPAGAFRVVSAQAVDARRSSDHRPVLAVLEVA